MNNQSINNVEDLFYTFYKLLITEYCSKNSKNSKLLKNGNLDNFLFFDQNKYILESKKERFPVKGTLFEKNFCFSIYKKIVFYKKQNKPVFLSKNQFQILKKILKKNKKNIFEKNIVSKKYFYELLYKKKTAKPLYNPKKNFVFADHIYKNKIGIYSESFKYLKNLINNYNYKLTCEKKKEETPNLYFLFSMHAFSYKYNKKLKMFIINVDKENFSRIVDFLYYFNNIKKSKNLEVFLRKFKENMFKNFIEIQINNEQNTLDVKAVNCGFVLKYLKTLELINNTSNIENKNNVDFVKTRNILLTKEDVVL